MEVLYHIPSYHCVLWIFIHFAQISPVFVIGEVAFVYMNSYLLGVLLLGFLRINKIYTFVYKPIQNYFCTPIFSYE